MNVNTTTLIPYIYIYDREDASSMVTAGATANTTVKNSCASRESGLLCSHSHGESIDRRGIGGDHCLNVAVREGASLAARYLEKKTRRFFLSGALVLINRRVHLG